MLSKKLACLTVGLILAAGISVAQTTSITGQVKGEDGKVIQGALVKIERKDIKGNYRVKTNRRGEYFHAGLPLGTYDVSVEVGGKEVDKVENVRTRLGDPTNVSFDLQTLRQRQAALQRAAETGEMTADQARQLTAEQREALEKAQKERAEALAKNKELNDAFNLGMQAFEAKQFDQSIEQFLKASELDPKQHVVWAHLAESYVGSATTKTGAEQEQLLAKALESFQKAIEIKPDDAAYHNNYALALARAKKFEEAQAELTKAASMDPPNAGRYYYNLGALLVNSGQNEPAGEAFKKAIEADPNYAEAHYQYGVFLVSQAKTTPEGKIIPPEGTREALEKYLALRPDGQFADSAKGMIATMESGVETQYRNPQASKPKSRRR